MRSSTATSAERPRHRRVVGLCVAVATLLVGLGVQLSGQTPGVLESEPRAINNAAPPLPPGKLTGPIAAKAPLPSRRTELRVSGSQLLGLDGSPIRLLGVNRSGTEYSCVQGWGIFDGASGPELADQIAGWGANAVRVPLNEDCWLGINGMAPEYSGGPYRQAIVDYVARLHARGLVTVLSLMWAAPGATRSASQERMADADHGPAFWRSVASTFAADPLAVFDPYGEPHGISWPCWRDGCVLGDGYRTAGMQSLVDAIRSTGARQPIVLSGIDYANDLSGWQQYEPHDPEHNVMAGFHLYDFNRCMTAGCWDAVVAPVAASTPVFTTELGESTCSGSFIESYMRWADVHRISYLGWAFNPWDCKTGPGLVTDDRGTPTPSGTVFRDHLLRAG